MMFMHIFNNNWKIGQKICDSKLKLKIIQMNGLRLTKEAQVYKMYKV